jgi:hypothetical protein
MNIDGNNTQKPFDQNLNTYDSVDFARVDVSGAILDNSQLATKLYVDTHGGGGGGGDMNYVGTTPATNYIYKAASSDGKSATKSNIVDTGSAVVVATRLRALEFDGQIVGGNLDIGRDQTTVTILADCIADKFVKTSGTGIQYLMANGDTLTQSASSGNSNFYLYQNKNGTAMTPPPLSGDLGYNNSVQSLATIVYISHLTQDVIDVEIFFNQVNQLNDLYIQDKESSLNFIKYNITGLPTIIANSYMAVPVSMSSYGGNGNNTFGVNHRILVAFFSNLSEIDTRLSNLETKTINQTAVAYATTFTGQTNFKSISTPYNQNLIIDNGSLVNTISSYAYNESQLCALEINSLTTEFNGAVDFNNGFTTSSLQSNLATFTGQINVGTSQTSSDIFNNGSSLTKNNFNTSQSVGCIGFKDNWATATGNTANIKQGMIFMSNVNRLIVISNLAPQYFDDATGALINITNGLPANGSFLFIPSLGIAYSKNATQYSTSTDGITWTIPANLVNGGTASGAIAYGNGLYVCSSGSAGNLIQTSTDGITWTNRVATLNIYTIIYTGSRFITFGSGGCMYSTDGLTWINDTVQTANIRAAIYCESLGCILAQLMSANTNLIRSYDSGLTWTTLTNVFPAQLAITSGGNNRFEWDNVSGKAYLIANDNSGFTNNAYVFEFDATGNSALGGSIQMMGDTSVLQVINGGLTHYKYNPTLKRFYYTRGAVPNPVFYSTTSNNLAVSGNQYIIGSLNCSGGYNPYGLANIDIMLRDTPFIGIQYQNSSGLNTTFSNSLWNAMGSSSSVGSTYALTNNFTRQLCAANWTTTALADGAHCGYASTITTGARVSTGFNFGLSAVLGISDSVYNSNNCQNFWGLWNLSTQVGLTQAIQLSTRTNMICFGSDTNDANICIYTAGASNTVKQVDLGASFPSNRPVGALSTDFFKFTLYWDTSKFYYKAVNTTTNVVVTGTFTALVADIPATSIQLYPQCVRVMGTPSINGSARLQVQRFGVYY